MKKMAVVFVIFVLFQVCQADIINVPEDFDSIQDGIMETTDGDTVLVQPGFYFENISFRGRAITLASMFLMTGDERYIDSTVIDADGRNAGVEFVNDEVETSILQGFAIQNGLRNIGGPSFGGGGVCIGMNTRPVLKNLHLINNRAEIIGGGICCNAGSRPVIDSCRIEYNTVYDAHWYGGGGIGILDGAHPVISNCMIQGNVLDDEGRGGGIACYRAGFELINTTVRSNVSSTGGGIYSIEADTVIMSNCKISYNDCDNSYGGICLGYNADAIRGYLDLDHVLISDNVAPTLSSFYIGLYRGVISNITVSNNEIDDELTGYFGWCDIVIRNSIFYGNPAPIGCNIRADIGSRISVDYCDVEWGRDGFIIEGDAENFIWGAHNINQDPLFVDPDNGDYSLSEDSPCINAGDPDSPHDPDDTVVDMGAFGYLQKDIEVNPLVLFFGEIETGAIDSLPLYISNRGSTMLTVEQVRMTENNHPFSIPGSDELFPTGLAGFSTISLWVVCHPVDLHQEPQAECVITSDDPDEGGIRVDVSCDILNAISQSDQAPVSFEIYNVYPNPFNSSTRITYSLPVQAQATLMIYNTRGQLVDVLVDGVMAAGRHSVVWDGDGFSAGVYFVKVRTGIENRFESRKVVMVK